MAEQFSCLSLFETFLSHSSLRTFTIFSCRFYSCPVPTKRPLNPHQTNLPLKFQTSTTYVAVYCDLSSNSFQLKSQFRLLPSLHPFTALSQPDCCPSSRHNPTSFPSSIFQIPSTRNFSAMIILTVSHLHHIAEKYC